MKIQIAIIIGLLILGVGVLYYNLHEDKPIQQNKLYAGPVPEGYDELFYRRTGYTMKKDG